MDDEKNRNIAGWPNSVKKYKYYCFAHFLYFYISFDISIVNKVNNFRILFIMFFGDPFDWPIILTETLNTNYFTCKSDKLYLY